MSFLIPQQLARIKFQNHALSMKYSICNIHLLPKAADLRKEAFDEFPLNMAILLLRLLFTECTDYISWLTSSSFLVPRVSLPNCMLGLSRFFLRETSKLPVRMVTPLLHPGNNG